MREYNYSEIDKELLPLSNEVRVKVIADAITSPFNHIFNKNTKVKGFYDKEEDRVYFIYDGCYVDVVGKYMTNLRWDVLTRAFEILEASLKHRYEADKNRTNSLNKEIDGELLARRLEQLPEVFERLTEDEVMEITARHLRKTLEESVDYGYDSKEREFFLSVPKYSKSAYIKHKHLRDCRWDLLIRAVELLEKAVNEEKEKENAECIR